MFQRFLEVPLIYKTKLTSESSENLLQKQKNSSPELNDEIDIELVLRSFNTRFYEEPFNKTKAVEICQKQLKKDPRHNLFSFALAMHQIDPQEKLRYLLIAVRSVHPAGEEISGQAAFELAKFFFQSQKYIESQAWLIQAIILGNSKALDSFQYGMGGDTGFFPPFEDVDDSLRNLSEIIIPLTATAAYPHLSALLLASFLAATLANIRFYPKTSSYWQVIPSYPGRDLAGELLQANCTNNLFSALMLYHDSYLGKIACEAAESSPDIFYKFFLYCAENNIISPEVDKAVMNFLANYPPHPCELLASSKIPTSNNIKDIPGRSRMFYICNARNVYFVVRWDKQTPVIKVPISNIDEFLSHMRPTDKGRILTATELDEIKSKTSFIPPLSVYPIDVKIIKNARERLYQPHENYLSCIPSSPSWTSSADMPQAVHDIPQMFIEKSRYVPPSILSDNEPRNVAENTQQFEAQFPEVPVTYLYGNSFFHHQPAAMSSSQNRTEDLKKRPTYG